MRAYVLLSTLIVVSFCGCSGQSFTEPENAPDIEAETIVEMKSRVLKVVGSMEEDANAGKEELSLLLEELEGAAGRVTQLNDVYELAQKANSDPSEESLSALKAAAEGLSGDIEAYRKKQAEMEN